MWWLRRFPFDSLNPRCKSCGTVDKKDWLTDKVISGGILNPERALAAAALMKNGKSMSEAIKKAKEAVADMPPKRGSRKPPMTQFELELYNSFAF